MSTPRTIDAGVGIGEIFLDKFRVDAILGHGGMGVVALCTHLALNERVAIKMLRRDVLDDFDAVERFMREAQAASRLKSEYVARVTDVGRSKANVPYMVMEYLEGHDLGELLDERGNLGRPWAVELTLQACEALAEAHSIGIVHRDVKPSNLFVTWRPDGSPLVKVLDFGISKAINGDGMQLTQTQSLLGTPAYMSPEQMRSARQVDARTDIWSLGTVLYEMLEGRRPFEAVSFSEMCVKVAVDPPGAMLNTPPRLQQVVLRCLAKAPEQRYASMAELARDLAPFSLDPHQAQVLAERMARTLRRSQVLDSGASPSEQRPAELAAASNPAIAVPAPSHPIAAGASLTETYAIPRGNRTRSRAIIAAAAIAAAATVGVAVSRMHGPAPAPAPTSRPSPPTPSIPPAVVPAADPPAALPRAADAAGDRRPATAPVRDAKPDAPVHRPARPVARSARPTAVPEPAAAPDAGTAVCDPFAEPHAANACPPGSTPRKLTTGDR